MALQGNFKYYTQVISETETETSTIIVPEDLPDWNPDYEFRGQTIEREFPVVTETETVIEDCYIQIVSFMFHKRMNTSEDLEEHLRDEFLDLYIRVYSSEASRSNNFNDFIREEHLLNKQVEVIDGTDLRTLAYNLLKQQRGYEEMVDA